jgi:hypothetical protein
VFILPKARENLFSLMDAAGAYKDNRQWAKPLLAKMPFDIFRR